MFNALSYLHIHNYRKKKWETVISKLRRKNPRIVRCLPCHLCFSCRDNEEPVYFPLPDRSGRLRKSLARRGEENQGGVLRDEGDVQGEGNGEEERAERHERAQAAVGAQESVSG